jgi:hypothetical protein
MAPPTNESTIKTKRRELILGSRCSTRLGAAGVLINALATERKPKGSGIYYSANPIWDRPKHVEKIASCWRPRPTHNLAISTKPASVGPRLRFMRSSAAVPIASRRVIWPAPCAPSRQCFLNRRWERQRNSGWILLKCDSVSRAPTAPLLWLQSTAALGPAVGPNSSPQLSSANDGGIKIEVVFFGPGEDHFTWGPARSGWRHTL